ncbi:MAG: HDOD domain-containing protein [Steroidobacteraceae bacterium]
MLKATVTPLRRQAQSVAPAQAHRRDVLLPAPPPGLAKWLAAAQPGCGNTEFDRLSREVLDRLFPAAAGPRMQKLWRRAESCAAYAGRIAITLQNQSRELCTLAGLLHEAGDALLLQQAVSHGDPRQVAIARDPDAPLQFDRRECEAMLRTLLRDWCLPVAVGTAALGWQRLGDYAVAGNDTACIKLAHWLMREELRMDPAGEADLQSLAMTMGVSPAQLDRLRGIEVESKHNN